MPIDRSKYPGIPDDFPIEEIPSSLAGAQPKLNLVEEDGQYYAPGSSPSEVDSAFEVCSDLVLQMIPYCTRKKSELAVTEEETLKRVLQGLINKGWCTTQQCRWIMKQVARQLNWQFDSSMA